MSTPLQTWVLAFAAARGLARVVDLHRFLGAHGVCVTFQAVSLWWNGSTRSLDKATVAQLVPLLTDAEKADLRRVQAGPGFDAPSTEAAA